MPNPVPNLSVAPPRSNVRYPVSLDRLSKGSELQSCLTHRLLDLQHKIYIATGSDEDEGGDGDEGNDGDDNEEHGESTSRLPLDEQPATPTRQVVIPGYDHLQKLLKTKRHEKMVEAFTVSQTVEELMNKLKIVRELLSQEQRRYTDQKVKRLGPMNEYLYYIDDVKAYDLILQNLAYIQDQGAPQNGQPADKQRIDKLLQTLPPNIANKLFTKTWSTEAKANRDIIRKLIAEMKDIEKRLNGVNIELLMRRIKEQLKNVDIGIQNTHVTRILKAVCPIFMETRESATDDEEALEGAFLTAIGADQKVQCTKREIHAPCWMTLYIQQMCPELHEAMMRVEEDMKKAQQEGRKSNLSEEEKKKAKEARDKKNQPVREAFEAEIGKITERRWLGFDKKQMMMEPPDALDDKVEDLEELTAVLKQFTLERLSRMAEPGIMTTGPSNAPAGHDYSAGFTIISPGKDHQKTPDLDHEPDGTGNLVDYLAVQDSILGDEGTTDLATDMTPAEKDAIRATGMTIEQVEAQAALVNFGWPTCFHLDWHDSPRGFCCVTPVGKWEGCPLYFPQLDLEVPLKPLETAIFRSSMLWHGNKELTSGTRYSFVYFMDHDLTKPIIRVLITANRRMIVTRHGVKKLSDGAATKWWTDQDL
ncbi:hypothetical protein HDV00_006655 [Rhizophlyctis rosea]|nr:hypothetical protein HDV00_006655 [Rhizophlyctis rosea]